MPRANYKPAYVAHIIILFVLLSKLTLSLCRCASVCVAIFFAVAHTPHVPLNAFINASPWPNSQHLFLVFLVACLSLPAFNMHTSFCIHDVLLDLKVMLPPRQLGAAYGLCRCLWRCLCALYVPRSPPSSLSLSLWCLCLLMPECQRRKTKALSDSNGNNKA